MNEKDKKIYDEICRLYYKYLDFPELYEKVEPKRDLNGAHTYWRVGSFYKGQHDMFIDELMKIFCHAGDKIKVVDEFPPYSRVYYRGVEMPKKAYLKNLKDGIYSFHRYGVFGMGNYLAVFKEMAEEYTAGQKQNVFEISLDDGTTMAKIGQVEGWIDDFIEEIKKNPDEYDKKVVDFICFDNREPYMFSIFAASHGIDAVTDLEHEIVCAINPSKVIYKEL